MSEDLLTASLLDDEHAHSLAGRVRGAIWGQLVGDAFCLGTHWIYDLDKLRQVHPDGVHGFEAPAADHYHAGKQPGDQTHYGDAALLLLQSVAELGRVEAQDFGRRFVEFFGSATCHSYLDHATKDTLANATAFSETHPGESFDYQQGGDDDQLATVSRLASVVSLLVLQGASQAELLRQVEAITRVTQNNDRAVAYAKADALILAALLAGKTLHEALRPTEEAVNGIDPVNGEEVRQKFRAAADATLQTVESATQEFGQSCPLEHSFPSSVHCLVKHSDSYNDAMLANASAGGDSAGRASMIGAWLGAHLGVEAIPTVWRERLGAHVQITAAIEKILAVSTRMAPTR